MCLWIYVRSTYVRTYEHTEGCRNGIQAVWNDGRGNVKKGKKINCRVQRM